MKRGLFWRLMTAFWLSLILSTAFFKLVMPRVGDSNAEFVQALATMLLVFVVISGTVMWLATRSVVRPLDWLRSGVQKFAAGELATRVNSQSTPASGSGEVAALIQDFNQMAEQVEVLVRAQRELLANVSHELRSPLARLALSVDMLRQFPEDREDHLARFENEIDKLNELIERLLTLSRIESSALPVNKDFFDLADLSAEIISDVQFEASGRGCSVAVVRSEQCPILGDRALLRTAIENVLRNAIQYSDEGTTVSVELSCRQKGSTITVTDFGPGLQEHELHGIFRPFIRGAAASSCRPEGHGLGLAIASKAVELHGGSIRARNTGSGLAVSIQLPLGSPVLLETSE